MITQFKSNSYRFSPLAVVLIVILACVSLPDSKRTKASEAFDPSHPITIRQVWKDPQVTGHTEAVSPNGRYVAFLDEETGDLAIHELETGANRRLTTAGGWKKGTNEGVMGGTPNTFVFSPDSSRIAYAWLGPDLRIIGLDAPEPRVLYKEESKSVLPIAWSPDGNNILVSLYAYMSPMNSHYGLVSVSDGSLHILESFPWDTNVNLAGFSPNGRYIVYDSPQEKDSPNSDVFLFALETGTHSRLVRHPANDKVLSWTPDGRGVLFSSDRRGTRDAWVIQVADDKPQGEPRLVKPDLGDACGLGFTQDGSFYYGFWTQPQDVYVATLDPETGKVVDPPKKVSLHREGMSARPDWSPDGRYLAYISEEPGQVPKQKIVIMDLKTGEYHELSTSMEGIFLPGVRWSPDGCSFILHGMKGSFTTTLGIYRIDAQTGEETLIKKCDGPGGPGEPEWTPDGTGIIYTQGGRIFGPYHIKLYDLETGEERELVVTPAGIRGGESALSPDGRQLAFTAFEKDTESVVLNVIPVAGGQPRELTRVPLSDSIGSLEWMPDGRNLLFTKAPYQKGGDLLARKATLWSVSVEIGAAPQETDMRDIPGLYLFSPRIHPDGRRIAFTSSPPKMGEIWVMENFLPKAIAQK